MMRSESTSALGHPSETKLILGAKPCCRSTNSWIPRSAKESCCGPAGVYTAHAAIELYAEAFESVDALDKLEAFAAFNGADFYGLPRNSGKLKLEKRAWKVPGSYAFGEDTVVPMRAGKTIAWRIAG